MMHYQGHRQTLVKANAALGDLYFTVFAEPNWTSDSFKLDELTKYDISSRLPLTDGYTARLSTKLVANLSNTNKFYHMCVQKKEGRGAMCSTLESSGATAKKPILAWYDAKDFDVTIAGTAPLDATTGKVPDTASYGVRQTLPQVVDQTT